jgi:hypothetical protein
MLIEVDGDLWESSKDLSSTTESSSKSTLFPARITERFAEARARASIRNVGSVEKEEYEDTSYTRIAPAAPR